MVVSSYSIINIRETIMRRIGFGLRFSALVIDVSVIILLVFGLYFGLGKHLYTTIGVMQKKSGIDPNAQIGAVIKGHTVAAEAAAPARTTGNTQQAAPATGENQTPAGPPREQRTRYALPTQEPTTTEQPQQQPTTPPVVVTEENRIDQEASKRPRGYIHNSKDFVKIFFFAIISILYFLIEGLKGISPGKWMLRLKIFNNDKEKAEKKNLLLRYIYKIAGPSFFILIYTLTKLNFLWTIGMIFFFIITLGCFFVFSNSMQTLHDRLTGSAVFSLYLKEETEESGEPVRQS